jgi:hypothetical protein
VADITQNAINEDENKLTLRGESNFVKSLLSFGTYLLLEGGKGAINRQLCTPLQPLISSELPNYHNSVKEAVEVNAASD